MDDVDVLVELLGDHHDRVVGERLGERGHLAHAHELLDEVGHRDAEVLRDVLDRRAGVDLDRVGGLLRLGVEGLELLLLVVGAAAPAAASARRAAGRGAARAAGAAAPAPPAGRPRGHDHAPPDPPPRWGAPARAPRGPGRGEAGGPRTARRGPPPALGGRSPVRWSSRVGRGPRWPPPPPPAPPWRWPPPAPPG